MTEEFDNNIMNDHQPSAPTTAQTADEAQQNVGFNTAAQAPQPQPTAYMPAQDQQYVNTAGQPVYTAYYPQPVYVAPTKKEHKLSTPARVLLWICGTAVALTVLFGCAVLCVLGARAVIGGGTATQTMPNSGSFPEGSEIDPFGGYSYGYGSGDTNPFSGFGLPDDWYNYGGGQSSQQSSGSNAGLGITATQLELEFTIDDKYDGGLVIVEINDDSSFTGTDVKVNDLIVAMDGKATPTLDDLKSELAKMEPGDKTTLTIARYENGIATTFDQEVTLVELKSE